jgi:hypothetical protein
MGGGEELWVEVGRRVKEELSTRLERTLRGLQSLRCKVRCKETDDETNPTLMLVPAFAEYHELIS